MALYLQAAVWAAPASFTTRAGTPTATVPSGITLPSGTSAPAPMMQPRPTLQPSSRVACIPIRLPSPTSAPWTMAPWPTVTSRPSRMWLPGSQWRTALSWMLVFSPMVMGPSSPRITAPYQTVEPGLRVTSPTTTALPATKAAPSSRGVFPQTEANIVKNHLSLFSVLWYLILKSARFAAPKEAWL